MNGLVRMLAVDDDPDILSGTARLLEKAGYSVDRASSGEDALQAAQTRHSPREITRIAKERRPVRSFAVNASS